MGRDPPDRKGGDDLAEEEAAGLKNPDDPETLTRRCVTIGDENARVVVWNEPWEIWKDAFTKRFVDPLPPETVLVVVDYHV